MEQKFRFRNREHYLKELNNSMSEESVMTRDLGGGRTSQYYPIYLQQALADVFFRKHNFIHAEYKEIQNELTAYVKLVYVPDYPDAEEEMTFGVASTSIQMDADSAVSDYPKKKKPNALEYCFPKVMSRAEGNAYSRIGNIFGRNLNRKVGNKPSDPYITPDFSLINDPNFNYSENENKPLI